MLFNRPSSILLASPQSYFEVEDDHCFIVDPYEVPPIQLLGKRLLSGNEYFPFLYLRSRFEGYHSLLLFASRDSSLLIAWKVKPNLLIEYVSQFQFPASDLVFLFTLVEASLSDIKFSITRSATDAPGWASEILHAIAHSLSNFSGLEECLSSCREYSKIPQAVFSPYTSAVNISISSLIDFILHCISSPESDQIIHLFEAFNARLGSDFDEASYAQIARYCILRELVGVVTGKHVVLDPFTWHHILSDCTAFYSANHNDQTPFGKARLIRYKSALGHYFVERRGPGWLDVTSSIILPNGLLVDAEANQQWGHRITPDEVQWVVKLFDSDSLPLVQEDQQLLYIDIGSGDNLGHVLWNEVSGYVEFILICQEAGWRPDKIVPILPTSIPSRFSRLGVRSSFYPFIHKTLRAHELAAEKAPLLNSYLDSTRQQELPCQLFFKNQIISFRYPRVSRAVSDAICQDLRSTRPGRVHLYKNIRFHNKCQTNTAECLQELFCRLEAQDNPRIHPSSIELHLEFSERHEDVISEITRVCMEHGVRLNLCESYEVSELLELVSSSCICIVPIGSGAVLPTWVFQKHTVLHSEAAHRAQMQWWHLAGNCDPSRLYLVPGDAIHDDPVTAGMGYSNYEIEPIAYATTVITALQDYLLSQVEPQLQQTPPSISRRTARPEESSTLVSHLKKRCGLKLWASHVIRSRFLKDIAKTLMLFMKRMRRVSRKK